jgi:hypothetical protein
MDYLFYALEGDEEMEGMTTMMIVSREYWDANQAIESRHIMDDLPDLPVCVDDEVAESIFVSTSDLETTIQEMKDAGFIWAPELVKAGQ